MDGRSMAFVLAGLGFAGFLYAFFNAAAVKAASEANYRKIRFGEKPTQDGFPVWFWRVLAAIGCIICGLLLLQIILLKSD
jgi:hypothetical protein